MPITVTSEAFSHQSTIPEQYTGEGADRSPPLSWSPLSPQAAAIVLICCDPDAPTADPWVHWVLYDLSPEVAGLAEDVGDAQTLKNGAKQGLNDFQTIGYGGPKPPPGRPHRYVFTVYAIDRPTGLPPCATKQQVMDAIDGHVLDSGELIGLYRHSL